MNVPPSWMGPNVTWAEVGNQDFRQSGGQTMSQQLASAGVKHVIEYTDPNLAPYCLASPSPSPQPTGIGVPEDGTLQCDNSTIEEAGHLHTVNGSYAHDFQHQGGSTDNGYRLYGITGMSGNSWYEPLNIHDPDVQAGFTALSNQNVGATDVFEDDAGGAYDCIPWFTYCPSGASYGPATYAPPKCLSAGTWCYSYGETAYEWDQYTGTNGPQQAYVQDAINLTNSSSKPVIGNNGAGGDTYDIEWAQNTGRLEGVMIEGAWGHFDGTLRWINNANAALQYHAMHKYVIEYYDSGASSNFIGQLASTWIVFDPTYSVEAITYNHPASGSTGNVPNNDTTFPEETIFPAQPRVTPAPSAPNVSTFQSAPNSNLYIREYAWCDQAGTGIGACAALVNIGSSAATIPTLSTTYNEVLQQNTSTTWYNGGTPTWSTSVPTTVPAGGGVILLHT
jgi:hypothetical protein